jgi:mercuric ion binding protein
VTKAEARLQRREAVVSFDNAKTNVDALTNATAKVGFPSKPKR